MRQLSLSREQSTLSELDVQVGVAAACARIAEVMSRLKMNQSGLAKSLGMSTGYISDVIRGKKMPGADLLAGLRSKFGVSVDWLLDGEGSMFGSGIEEETFRSIRLQIALVREAVLGGNVVAEQVLDAIAAERTVEISLNPEFANLLVQLDAEDRVSDLATALYNELQTARRAGTSVPSIPAAARSYFRGERAADRAASILKTLRRSA